MKESAEFKQKWEDEIDANKTWKRKHANNVKVGKYMMHISVELNGIQWMITLFCCVKKYFQLIPD